MNNLKIKKNDKVVVLSGKDKGKTGKVLPSVETDVEPLRSHATSPLLNCSMDFPSALPLTSFPFIPPVAVSLR